MNTTRLLIHDGPDLPGIPARDGLSCAEALAAPEEQPDARIFLIDAAGSSTAHAALWWRHTPLLDGRKTGAIGGFDAVDADAAALLLNRAALHLRNAGCTIALGPMNGNTWRRHRFVIESNGRGPFLLEPRNPAAHPGWWRSAGFYELSHYTSSAMPLDEEPAVSPVVKTRMESSGVVIRPLDPGRYDDELRAIHALSLRSFSNNFLYTTLEEASFLESYQKVRDSVDPRLVRIAERDGIPCGFIFAIADLEAAACGEKPALIVKTLAVDSSSRSAGLGALLVDEAHRQGLEMGFTEAIHALQHETNTSLKITHRHKGEPFRRYALFARPL
ncbi:MAG TPA: GNAT family N-acetyltransferase [Verrucomicrobiales bacterium]|nr:GNAT family N-acetyltransferase [Verrucomicrobiales bacterium]